jgi:nucleotide-binding universal stress UspA family protein
MFKHLLVPLDGSHLAEAALPAAIYFAKALNARVSLLHVIERDAPQEIHGERHLTNIDDARRYIDDVAARTFPPELTVERHIHSNEVNNVAQSIAEHEMELGTDLIVMCTHGRGGLRDLMFGRIAQQVVGLGTTPILLIPPSMSEVAPTFQCKRMLVTLDGNPDHEEGLNVAASLAKACGSELSLIMVVQKYNTLFGEEAATAKILPGATHILLDLAELDAKEYLHRHVAALQSAGIMARADVRRGDPVTTIVVTAKETEVDLIALATHGKTGMDAFWSGSATPNVTRRSVIPLLLVPVRREERGT